MDVNSRGQMYEAESEHAHAPRAKRQGGPRGKAGLNFCHRNFVYVDGWQEQPVDGTAVGCEISKEDDPVLLSVMSYNILADRYAKTHANELYSSVPKACMRWNTRANMMAKEISCWSPDIVCLQEVDRFKHLQNLLRPQGYRGTYLQRTAGRPDGLAIFWKHDSISLVHQEDVSFASYDLRDNVAQICVFKLKSHHHKEDPMVVVSNIHVLFNPKRGDIKLGQVRILLDRVHNVLHKFHTDWPGILCGDFNSSPSSALHRFITTGEINLLSTSRREVSGQISDARSPPVAYGGEDHHKPHAKQGAKKNKPWKLEEINTATGIENTNMESCVSVLKHHLNIRSSYSDVLGDEPLFSTAHDKYFGTVDYIFYSNSHNLDRYRWHARPMKVLGVPPVQRILPKGLPSGFWPSDHVSLMTTFQIFQPSRENGLE